VVLVCKGSDAYEVERGKREITADAALDLAKALGTSAKLWMNPAGYLRLGSDQKTT
jgi:plasmid maintenance system antidote protein VapI